MYPDIELLPVDREVGRPAGLVPAKVLQLLKLLAEPEVAVGRHDPAEEKVKVGNTSHLAPVVLAEVLQLDGAGSLDDGIRKTHLECDHNVYST